MPAYVSSLRSEAMTVVQGRASRVDTRPSPSPRVFSDDEVDGITRNCLIAIVPESFYVQDWIRTWRGRGSQVVAAGRGLHCSVVTEATGPQRSHDRHRRPQIRLVAVYLELRPCLRVSSG